MLSKHLHVLELLVATSFSESILIRYGGYVMLVSPLLCDAAFMWILAMKPRVRVDTDDAEKV